MNDNSDIHTKSNAFHEQHKGTYKFTSGTVYTGEMKDGQFHGKGTLFFQNGAKWEGHFEQGRARNGQYIFADGLKFLANYQPEDEFDDSAWGYCIGEDRRFFNETTHGMKPAGRSQLSNSTNTPEIPESSYDVGDGYYIPDERTVYTYAGEWKRIADDEEHESILKYCRKGWDETVGVLVKK